jgi:hypothetical protein
MIEAGSAGKWSARKMENGLQGMKQGLQERERHGCDGNKAIA